MPYRDKRKARVASRLAKRRSAAKRAAARRAAAGKKPRVPTPAPIRLESANDVLRLLRRTLAVLDGLDISGPEHVRLALSVARCALPAVELGALEARMAAIEATLREKGLLE